jgi:hypothetical protein
LAKTLAIVQHRLAHPNPFLLGRCLKAFEVSA